MKRLWRWLTNHVVTLPREEVTGQPKQVDPNRPWWTIGLRWRF